MSDAIRPTPQDIGTRFWFLLFGCIAAPIFWLGQLLLAYWISAEVCYGGDHPTTTTMPGALHAALYAFDIVAVVAAVVGGIVSIVCWRATSGEVRDDRHFAFLIRAGRARFMALWGIFSSLCFLIAIVFNVIASVTVPLCTR